MYCHTADFRSRIQEDRSLEKIITIDEEYETLSQQNTTKKFSFTTSPSQSVSKEIISPHKRSLDFTIDSDMLVPSQEESLANSNYIFNSNFIPLNDTT